jgi:hypothetical protein
MFAKGQTEKSSLRAYGIRLCPMRDMCIGNFGVVLKRILPRRIFEWLLRRMIDS